MVAKALGAVWRALRVVLVVPAGLLFPVKLAALWLIVWRHGRVLVRACRQGLHRSTG